MVLSRRKGLPRSAAEKKELCRKDGKALLNLKLIQCFYFTAKRALPSLDCKAVYALVAQHLY